MPMALFNRGRKGATSTRFSIRRAGAGGGSLLMARIRTDRSLRRRPRPARGDDRMSALPDDLLLLVLRRLDTRTALGTGLLSRRWGRLQRELPALDFKVSNMLPPRYHGLVFLHHDTNRNGSHRLFKKFAFMPNIMRYERRAMRALTSSVESFLDEDGARGASRSLSRLRLEFFITHNTGCMNRLIAKCIDHWGVRDLEAVARPIYFQQSVHTFPSYGLCQGASRFVLAKPQAWRLHAPASARVQRAHYARPARHSEIDSNGSLRGRLHLVPAAAGATPQVLRLPLGHGPVGGRPQLADQGARP
uniref:F-box domain-containing protein n=1 Tax=Aegilops tauschii subsp. strangulata TaxID=200361 RepID=A0A453PN32_AEGTS